MDSVARSASHDSFFCWRFVPGLHGFRGSKAIRRRGWTALGASA